MARKLSSIAPDWWDYTTLNEDIIRDAAALTADKMLKLSRPGFKVATYDTLEEFYLAEALEYITAWKQSSAGHPAWAVCPAPVVVVVALGASPEPDYRVAWVHHPTVADGD